MAQEVKLSKDQVTRIEATLKRIKRGLQKAHIQNMQEPIHIFTPEALNARNS